MVAGPMPLSWELGFYFVVGLLWLRKNAKTTCSDNIFYMPEILLLGASFLVASFFRSTIAANDLGWRGWMFGQFVLLIWAVDIGRDYLILKSDSPYSRPVSDKKSIKDDSILRQLMVIGMLTTVLSMFLLRFWPILIDAGVTGVPVNLSPDTQLGARTYAARQAYEYMRDCLPKDVIVQYNPLIQQDRPSGLYGNRQMATGGHSDYGALPEAFESLKQDIGAIFRNTDTDWIDIDQNCKQHEIDVIILSELDPLWQNLLLLSQQRVALYQNSRVAVFACGDFAGRQSIAAKMPFKYP